MAKFQVTARRVTEYEDWVEADSLDEANKIVVEWIADDFTMVTNEWEVSFWEQADDE